MKLHNLPQGSAQWRAHRAKHRNASDAAAMLGCSPYKTRDELLRECTTGLTPEVDAMTQSRFDDGHRFEALARPLAESIVGDDLYPVVGSDGIYSASFDGLTMDRTIAFEHKRLNKALAGVLHPDGAEIDEQLPLHYRVQMEQQCMVSGATLILFMASEWDGEELVEERHCWYTPDPALRARIIAGWDQFQADLAAYVPPAVVEPTVVNMIGALPALTVSVEGRVTSSNLNVFRVAAIEFLSKIKTELKTDQDFADAAATVKFCEEGEKRLELVKAQALAQTASIEELFRTIDDISGQMRVKRLTLDKLVKSRKEEIRTEIVTAGQKALAAHYQALNTRLGNAWMPRVDAGFADVIKGLKTVTSIRNAVDTELARAKIDANAIADRIDANRKASIIDGKDWMFLLVDFAALATDLEPVAFSAVLAQRIAQHEARVAEALQAAEQTRIVVASVAAAAAPAPAPAPAVVSMRSGLIAVAAARTGERPTINAGALCKRLGFVLTVDFLTDDLHVPPALTERRSSLWTETQFLTICERLQAHIATVARQVQDEAISA